MENEKPVNVKIIFAYLWLMFTLALVGWWIWLLFSLFNNSVESTNHLIQNQHKIKNMIIWEGGTLILLILAGALPLIYLLQKERMRTVKFIKFFSYFSHDLKTSMSSLKLQVECLLDLLTNKDDESIKLLNRILSDTNRLQLQLENSLYVSQLGNPQVFLENVNLIDFFEKLKFRWPHLKFTINGSGIVSADQRILETIFNNICQNSSLHGKATELNVTIDKLNEDKVKIVCHDNGLGFNGPIENLSQAFVRHSSTSGSGLGLFLIKKLTQHIGAEFAIKDVNEGFSVEFIFQGMKRA